MSVSICPPKVTQIDLLREPCPT